MKKREMMTFVLKVYILLETKHGGRRGIEDLVRINRKSVIQREAEGTSMVEIKNLPSA